MEEMARAKAGEQVILSDQGIPVKRPIFARQSGDAT